MSKTPDGWKSVTAKYFPAANSVRIPINSTEVYPKYMKYLFEYLKIPQDAKIVFKDRTIEGGVKEWLKE